MTRFIRLVVTVSLGITLACNDNSTTRTKRVGEPTVYGVHDSDDEMNAAVEKAQKTLNIFDNALQSHDPNFKHFALKQKFNTPEGGEHIWLMGIEKRGEDYEGVINNVPNSTGEVQFGDTIVIKRHSISDWMYEDNGIMRGGFTVKALRNRMSKEERQSFDRDFQLVIGEDN